jgi:hypothetical protein
MNILGNLEKFVNIDNCSEIIINRRQIINDSKKVNKFTVTMDRISYIFKANSLLQVEIKTKRIAETHTSSGNLTIHDNVGKTFIMSENLELNGNIEGRANIMSENIKIKGEFKENANIISERISYNINKKTQIIKVNLLLTIIFYPTTMRTKI